MGSKAQIVLNQPRAFQGVMRSPGHVLATVELADGITSEKLQLALQLAAASVVAEPEPAPETPPTKAPEAPPAKAPEPKVTEEAKAKK